MRKFLGAVALVLMVAGSAGGEWRGYVGNHGFDVWVESWASENRAPGENIWVSVPGGSRLLGVRIGQQFVFSKKSCAKATFRVRMIVSSQVPLLDGNQEVREVERNPFRPDGCFHRGDTVSVTLGLAWEAAEHVVRLVVEVAPHAAGDFLVAWVAVDSEVEGL